MVGIFCKKNHLEFIHSCFSLNFGWAVAPVINKEMYYGFNVKMKVQAEKNALKVNIKGFFFKILFIWNMALT